VNEALPFSAKKFEENRRLDPSAASILANPRSTAEQRIRATARLADARRRQQTNNLAPNVSKFRAAIIGKESEGDYGAVNPDSGALGIGQVASHKEIERQLRLINRENEKLTAQMAAQAKETRTTSVKNGCSQKGWSWSSY
jgi:hypothetical protein